MSRNVQATNKRIADPNGKMRCYTFREMDRIVRQNGYIHTGCNGSHHVYKKQGAKPITLAKHRNVNICIARRIIRENGLRID